MYTTALTSQPGRRPSTDRQPAMSLRWPAATNGDEPFRSSYNYVWLGLVILRPTPLKRPPSIDVQLTWRRKDLETKNCKDFGDSVFSGSMMVVK